jgi:alpha-tubulin suppressor-like RCC1 family protein
MRPLARAWLAPGLTLITILPGCREQLEPSGADPGPRLATAEAAPLSFSHVTAGRDYSCGLTSDQLAFCWGANYAGALGNGTANQSLIPAAVSGGLHFRQIDAGNEHACGVTTDNRAYCWGENQLGQLGDGSITDRLSPRAVAGGLRFRQVSAGMLHTCGVTTDDRVYCWGWDGYGQLGDTASLNKQKRPVRVDTGRRFRSVSAGGRHTCGVTTDNRAFCWGDGSTGQIGDGLIVEKRTRPRAVAGGLVFREVVAQAQSTSGGYSCGVTTDNKAYCWGLNFDGQLGDGTTTQRVKPVAVAGGIQFRGLSLGERHTCGASTGNVAYCWGYNYYGQLGDGGPLGDAASVHLSPFAVTGGGQYAGVAAGVTHTCGARIGGAGYCWGANTAGQLGDGMAYFATSTPVAIVGPS